MIALGVLFFAFGSRISLLFRRVSFKNTHDRLCNAKKIYDINYNFITILTVICILYYLPQFIIALYSMISGISLNAVRGVLQAAENSTGWSNFIGNYVILPISVVLEILVPLDFWLGKRKHSFFALGLILILERTFGLGGRTPLFDFVLYFILAYFIKKRFDTEYVNGRSMVKSKKNDKIKMRFYTILGLFGLAIVTFMRALGSLIRKLYFYFAMSPVLLTNWSETVDLKKYAGYGLISFNGVFYLFDYLRKNILFGDYIQSVIEAYNFIASTDSNWIRITSGGTTANAYVSCFWFFYADGGFIAVASLSFVFGFISSVFFYKCLKTNDLKKVSIYFLLYQSVFFSFIRFPFGKAYYIIALIALSTFSFKSRATDANK